MGRIHCVAAGKHMCLDVGSTPTCGDAPFNTFAYWFVIVKQPRFSIYNFSVNFVI